MVTEVLKREAVKEAEYREARAKHEEEVLGSSFGVEFLGLAGFRSGLASGPRK